MHLAWNHMFAKNHSQRPTVRQDERVIIGCSLSCLFWPEGACPWRNGIHSGLLLPRVKEKISVAGEISTVKDVDTRNSRPGHCRFRAASVLLLQAICEVNHIFCGWTSKCCFLCLLGDRVWFVIGVGTFSNKWKSEAHRWKFVYSSNYRRGHEIPIRSKGLREEFAVWRL